MCAEYLIQLPTLLHLNLWSTHVSLGFMKSIKRLGPYDLSHQLERRRPLKISVLLETTLTDHRV